MAALPLIELFLGAEKQTLSVLRVERLETHYQVNGIPTAKLVMAMPGQTVGLLGKAQSDLSLCRAGVAAVVTLRDGVHSRDEVIFSGYVSRQHVNVSRHSMEFTLELRHGLQKLLNTHRSQVFTNTTDAAIAYSLLTEQDIIPSSVEGMTTEYEQLVQFRSSDWHFLYSRLRANGVWLFPSPKSVRIAPPTLVSVADGVLSASNEEDLRQMESGQWAFSERHQPAAVNVSFWDDLTQTDKTQIGTATPLGTQAFDPANGLPLSSVPWTYSYSTPLGTPAATALAGSLLTNLQSGYAEGAFITAGTLDFTLGQTLALSGFGRELDGKEVISGVHQYISRSTGWRTRLTLGENALLSDGPLVPGVGGLHIGVISTFESDSSQMNRFKVRVPVLGEACPALWARFASPYASNQSGFCFYPQPGDEVVLGFFDSDPCYPIILGAMHSKINQAPVAPDAENQIKALVVLNGDRRGQLAFDAASQTVELSAENDALSLGQGTTLSSETQTRLEADDVTLDGGEVTITGKETVVVTGARIDLSQ